MHELSIALSLLDLAAEEAQRQKASRVVAIHLKLGLLSGVDRDALQNAFELAREGSDLGAAALIVEEVPITIHCSTCAAERSGMPPQNLVCSVCGAPPARIVCGQEMELTALEIET